MRAAWVAIALALAACTSSLVEYEPRVHIVQPGETLATIAWAYGLDYRDIARWNGLDDPDVIQAGQRLRLTPRPSGDAAPPSAGRQSSGEPAAPDTRSPTPRGASSASSPPANATQPAGSSSPAWRWPAPGSVVSAFGSTDGPRTGIGIGGAAGEPVEAAAGGRVVYAGSGLIGYGQLVIIRHNDSYLSAYGHNSRLLVEQGDDVAQGQRIAEMGIGPERRPRLHFEIRRNGTPVDPLELLPKR